MAGFLYRIGRAGAAHRLVAIGVWLGVAFALLAAVTLDGVPENLALGVSLVGSEGELSGVIAFMATMFLFVAMRLRRR